MEPMLSAFAAFAAPMPLIFLFLGVTAGVVIGAIPGLTGGMVIALTLPLTFVMDSVNAMILLVAMYVGSTAGGLVAAALLKMPGTPAAMMTTLDAYPMAQSGRPGRALGLGIYASFIGGLVSWIFLAGLSPSLSEFAVRFGPYEIFSMAVLALLMIAAVGGGTMGKAMLAGILGVMASLVGVDGASGIQRMTFGIQYFEGGFAMLPVILGTLVLSQVFLDAGKIMEKMEASAAGVRSSLLKMRDLVPHRWNLLRSSLVGTWIGILPGIGGTTAAIASYSLAKRLSSKPEKFGHGSEEGIIASETANNAAVNGALVPLITLGIPGSVVDVLLLGALIIQGLTPGPLLFVEAPEMAYGIIAAALLANVLMFALMLGFTPVISKVMNIDRVFIIPIIIVFCVIGAFSQANQLFDVWVMIGFGVLGYLMTRARVPLGPFVIGYILAPIAELNLRSGLQLYDGSLAPLITRPVSLFFCVIGAAMVFGPLIIRASRKFRQGSTQ